MPPFWLYFTLKLLGCKAYVNDYEGIERLIFLCYNDKNILDNLMKEVTS